jgi:hydrogenase maturation protease
MTILLCGIGNVERGDDGFGPYIIRNINKTQNIKTIDCGIYLENYLTKIVECDADLIVLLDTIRVDGKETLLLRNEEIVQNQALSVTTHNLPISAVYEFLREQGPADVWFLGIRPLSYQHFSEKIKAFADHLIAFFLLLDKQDKINIINIYENLSSTLR